MGLDLEAIVPVQLELESQELEALPMSPQSELEVPEVSGFRGVAVEILARWVLPGNCLVIGLEWAGFEAIAVLRQSEEMIHFDLSEMHRYPPDVATGWLAPD